MCAEAPEQAWCKRSHLPRSWQGSAGQHREAAWDGKHCMLVSQTASVSTCPQRDSTNREDEYLWEEAVRERERETDKETERREKKERRKGDRFLFIALYL